MREELINLLACPSCKHENLILTIEKSDYREVKEGKLRCLKCGSRYPITNGVVELISGLDEETNKEWNAREKSRDWSIERQRPYINDNFAQPWIWPAFAANVEQGLDSIDLEGKIIVDIGAATCWATRMMAERGAIAIAVDISTSMLVDGEAQYSDQIYFDRIATNMSVLPFKDASVHAIFFSSSIHHTSDLAMVIKECVRCLMEGGCLVLVNEPVKGILRRRANFGKDDLAAGINEHIFSYNQYRSAAQSSGLEPAIYFPDSLRKQLNGKSPYPPTIGIKTFRIIWPLIKRFAEKMVHPMHWLLGGELILIAHKYCIKSQMHKTIK